MKTIPLTKGKAALVDDEDYALLSRFKWHATLTQRSKPDRYWYARRCYKGKLIRMHREILGFPPAFVDHINGNGLDNRRVNLRIATRSQNAANSPRHRNSTIPFKGVSHDKYGGWGAMICRDGRIRWLGRFRTAEEARDAYRAASKALFGEYGRSD